MSRKYKRICIDCKKVKIVDRRVPPRRCTKCAGAKRAQNVWGGEKYQQMLDFFDWTREKVSPKRYKFYTNVTCPDCKKVRKLERSYIMKCYKAQNTFKIKCYKCWRKWAVGKNSPVWKGGVTQDGNGYVMVYITEDDPYYGMSRSTGGGTRYISEHRYKMAKKLGRPLTEFEHVHHINGIKDDNRMENLKLLNKETHTLVTRMESEIIRLREENQQLRDQVGTAPETI